MVQELMLEMTSHPHLFWIACAAIAGILEVTVPSFTFIFVSMAAACAAVASFVSGWTAQTLIFGGTLIAFAVVLRPIFTSKKAAQAKGHSRVEALLGKMGKVIEPIDGQTTMGRVIVAGEDWAAKSRVPIKVDEEIIVESADGIVLMVRKI